LSPLFKKAGIKSGYPDELLILAFKQERVVELLGRKSGDKGYRFIKRYPIRAASGMLGPKLREGDYQVPEGFYRITFLHPNSSYHLSMKLNYPNEDDLKYAKKEGRTSPGSNIFIHGKAVSRGCIALGDSAIEELFVLVAKAGKSHAQVVISPFDFRKKQSIALPGEPEWIVARYKKIEEYLKKIPDETKDLDEK
jgi:murein L,D-transpeptidase YafK